MLLLHKHLDRLTRQMKTHEHETYGHRELMTHRHLDDHLGSWDDLRARAGRRRRYPEDKGYETTGNPAP